MRGNVVQSLLDDQGDACFMNKATVPAPQPTPPQPQPPQPQPAPPAPPTVNIGVQVDQANRQIILATKEATPTTVRISEAGAAGLIADLNNAVSQLGGTNG